MAAKLNRKQFEKTATQGYEAYVEGDLEGAEEQLVTAVEMAGSLQIRDMGLASVLNTLAGVYRATGRDEEALDPCEQAFEIMKNECEEGDEDLVGVARNLAQIYDELDRPEEALKWARQAFEVADGNPKVRAQAAVAYADRLLAAGEAQKAHDLLVAERDSMLELLSSPANPMGMFTDPLGEMIKEEFREERREPPVLLLLRVELAKVKHALGQDDDSIAFLPEMGTFEARTHGDDSIELGRQYQEVAIALHFLAQDTRKREHFTKAGEYYERALKIYIKVHGADSPALKTLRSNMAELKEDVAKL